MLSQQRQKLILTYLKNQGSAHVQQLSDQFGISLSTVRRDLSDMETRGLIRRVHGGAMLTDGEGETPLKDRANEYSAQKQRIGEAAARLVEDGQTILITSGTTTEAMLPFLNECVNLTVITNALNIAFKLVPFAHINVIVLGGWLRHSEYSLLGHLTTDALAELRASRIFHGTYGISPIIGLTGMSIHEVETDRRLISAAGELVVLADSSKFGQTGAVRLASLDEIGTVITDDGAPPADLVALKSSGINVIVA